MSRKLTRRFYRRPTLEVARDLLGREIVFETFDQRFAARIVEVEAYVGRDDPACHAANGMTDRNRVMFGPPGFSYVYFIYGMYYCFNIVTEEDGFPAAVLLRAAEPTDGVDRMWERSPKDRLAKLLSGPGKFCRAFGLTTEHSGIDLTGRVLYVLDSLDTTGEIVTSGRIGISRGEDLPYRFYLADSASVSGKRG